MRRRPPSLSLTEIVLGTFRRVSTLSLAPVLACVNPFCTGVYYVASRRNFIAEHEQFRC